MPHTPRSRARRERKRAGVADEGEQVLFRFEEDDAGEHSSGARQQRDLDFGDDAERALAADEEVYQVHARRDVVACGVLARGGHRVRGQTPFDVSPAAERDVEATVRAGERAGLLWRARSSGGGRSAWSGRT